MPPHNSPLLRREVALALGVLASNPAHYPFFVLAAQELTLRPAEEAKARHSNYAHSNDTRGTSSVTSSRTGSPVSSSRKVSSGSMSETGSPVDLSLSNGSIDHAADARRVLRGLPTGIGSGVRSDGGGGRVMLGSSPAGAGPGAGLANGRMVEMSPMTYGLALPSPSSARHVVANGVAAPVSADGAQATELAEDGDGDGGSGGGVVLEVMGDAAPMYARLWITLVTMQKSDPFPPVAHAANTVVSFIIEEASRWFAAEVGGGFDGAQEAPLSGDVRQGQREGAGAAAAVMSPAVLSGAERGSVAMGGDGLSMYNSVARNAVR